MGTAERAPVVDLRDISKRFGGTVALDRVSLTVGRGEILGLIGENGAGKSTLMNIMSGALWPDSGEIRLDGRLHSRLSPAQAQHLGVQIVHQELSLLPEMTVAENIFLGKEPRRGPGVIRRQACIDQARQLLEQFSIPLDPRQKVAELSAAQKQLVEICKSLAGQVKVLILDEPTSSLTEREMACLQRILPLLREQGAAIIFISHKLDEVRALCDTLAVLRDGSLVKTAPMDGVTEEDMVRFMVGRNIRDQYTPPAYDGPPRPVLEIRGLCSARYGEVSLRDVSLEVRAGEIVGMFGLIGSGRTELIQALHGLRPIQGGSVAVEGEPVTRFSPRQLIRRGVAWVTEDRRHEGVCLSMSIANNIALPIYRQVSRMGVIRGKDLAAVVQTYMERLAIKAAGPGAPCQTLSGGNQQKVVLAKWLAAGPRLLILDEPTRGIDVGSKTEIHRLIRQLRDAGMAILVISSEMPELFSLADRLLVMKNGVISGQLPRGADGPPAEDAVMKLATIGA